MKTAEPQQNQSFIYLSPEGAFEAGEKSAKSLENHTKNSTQVVMSQGFIFSPGTLSDCQELSARKPLRCNDFRFRTFRRPLYRVLGEKFLPAGKPGGAPPPLGSGGASPLTGLSATRTPGENAGIEHISNITRRVLEAWGRRVRP